MFAVFDRAAFERDTADLPTTIDAAVPVLRGIIERYNRACLGGDQNAKEIERERARLLAVKLNDGTHFGIKVHGGICDQLETLTRAPEGNFPLWGQAGIFVLTVRGCAVLIEWGGLYGICEIGFCAHAVSWDAPFISETGYRSFLLSHHSDVTGGCEPVSDFVRGVVESHIDTQLRGRLVPIAPAYRNRAPPQGTEPHPAQEPGP